MWSGGDRVVARSNKLSVNGVCYVLEFVSLRDCRHDVVGVLGGLDNLDHDGVIRGYDSLHRILQVQRNQRDTDQRPALVLHRLLDEHGGRGLHLLDARRAHAHHFRMSIESIAG